MSLVLCFIWDEDSMLPLFVLFLRRILLSSSVNSEIGYNLVGNATPGSFALGLPFDVKTNCGPLFDNITTYCLLPLNRGRMYYLSINLS